MTTEARAMEYARSHGYPVPAIEEVSGDGTDLVMERVDGPSMSAALTRRPWSMRRHGTVLADLHRRLHDIPGPEWLPPGPCGEGDRLLHLDLHPLNVILTTKGPVVIDWPNAARGDGAIDVVLTWILMATAGMPEGRINAAVQRRGRALLVSGFLRHFDPAAIRQHLADVVAWKATDPNTSLAEQAAMWRLATGTDGN